MTWRYQDDHFVLYSIDNRIPGRNRKAFCVDDIGGISPDTVLIRDYDGYMRDRTCSISARCCRSCSGDHRDHSLVRRWKTSRRINIWVLV